MSRLTISVFQEDAMERRNSDGGGGGDVASSEPIEYDSVSELSSTMRSLSLHPKYLDRFRAAHSYLLTGQGPLHFAERHYLAVMVSMESTYFQIGTVEPQLASPLSAARAICHARASRST